MYNLYSQKKSQAEVRDLAKAMGATDPKLVAAAVAGGAPVPGNHSPQFAPVWRKADIGLIGTE